MAKYVRKVCVVGGGNIGTSLLADLGKKENLDVRLYTSHPERWSSKIEIWKNDQIESISTINKISNNPEDVIGDADIIISTVPSHIFPQIIEEIKSFVKPGTWIGIMPGTGGGEFYCKDLVERGCVLFGFQRVHGIARVKEYGKSVYDLGRKSELKIATVPSVRAKEVSDELEKMLDIKCTQIPNYLCVTFTPSNPILHTSRLYSLFGNYTEGMRWNKNIEFYSDWDDKSSHMLIESDIELQNICNSIRGLDLTSVESLRMYYESDTVEAMTRKISSIPAFAGIYAPMIYDGKGFFPDLKSRYFQEDFPYGLAIIKGFADIVNVDTPYIDKILLWFEKIQDVEYYIEGKFCGEDTKELPLPQSFGIRSLDDIVNFYK